MKTIIALTDFSPHGNHACHYAAALAAQTGDTLLLCNVYLEPASFPGAYSIGWPTEEFNLLEQESNGTLQLLRQQLEEEWPALLAANKSRISTASTAGDVAAVLTDLDNTGAISLVVAGTHSESGFVELFFGNKMRTLIDTARHPLLLVPLESPMPHLKKLVFATDMEFPEQDIAALRVLKKLTVKTGAELLVTTVLNEDDHGSAWAKEEQQMMSDLSHMAGNIDVKCKVIKGDHVDNVLLRFCTEEKADLLTMVHHNLGMIKRLFKGSTTKKVAGTSGIPLLVIPACLA